MMVDFEAKRNALFACLDDASSELKGTSLDQTSVIKNPLKRTSSGGTELVYRNSIKSPHKNQSIDRSLKSLRGKESIFKKPELPISRCLKPRTLPDFKVNPHKWKKYSLEDVDISDHTNTSAAFEFLREIDARKETDGDDEGTETVQHKKIEFKKSSKLSRNIKTLKAQEQEDVEIDSPKLKGSKLIMPEYIIGGSKKPNKVSRVKNDKKDRAAGKLMLSHLHEEDEEE
uniref:U5 small nuclear ribonucleoprotein TSSC4 n=1 Tax=Musca domestica TaxID=7370 RepID=A0A1I8MTH8_MUSDO